MNRQYRLLTLLGSIILATLSGCGGGRMSTPPIGGAPGALNLQGVVSVRTNLLSARTAAAAETLVAGATVAFYEEGRNTPQAQATTNAQGRYTLLIRSGVRGRVLVTQQNRQLSALVVTGTQTTGTITRNVSLESTVVEVALRGQTTDNVDVEAMEEQVRIGETSDLLHEVSDAFVDNRAPAPTQTVVTQTATQLVTGEQTTTRDCLAGQEWCVVAAKLEVSGSAANTYTSRLLLRRDRTDSGNTDTSTATVGAGHLVLQLPSGFTLQTLTGTSGMVIDQGDAQTDNTVQISFLYGEEAGFDEAAKLAELTLTTTRTPTADDRLSVTSQRLLGVLNEKRAATPNSTPKSATAVP